MIVENATCPRISVLSDFGLGKLDAASAETVSQHLETCDECRHRVASFPGDSFIARLRDAHSPDNSEGGSQASTRDEARVGGEGESKPDETAPAQARESAQHAQMPAAFGRYLVRGLLGEGGFGVVYLGHDPELCRAVAVKVPRRERVAAPADAEANLAEARLLAAFDHPGIVPVYDFGRTDDGVCYVVSQYMPGGDLATLLARRRLTVEEAVEFTARIAEALQHAHQQGLVHRDIKPGNILLDQKGHPLVADFGMALTDERYGRAAGAFGTPTYMSPEQARGESHLVDARSDIYSLGVLFYEMLTGRRPYRRTELRELLEEISRHDIRPPRQLDPTIPTELERVCLKALAKLPADRYTTAFDLAEDLRRWQARPESADISPADLLAARLRGGNGASTSKKLATRSRRFKVLFGCGGLLTLSFTATLGALALMVALRDPVQVAYNAAPTERRARLPTLGKPEARQRIADHAPPWPDSPPAPADSAESLETARGIGRPLAYPASAMAPKPSPATLRVVSIDVQHFARVNDNEAQPRGILGKQSFAPRLGDQVTIEARLSRPAYAYLLAFRPDGVIELCFPEDESQPPPITDHPRYPSASNPAQTRYGLAEGAGLWVFAVVASDEPMPAYRDFVERQKPNWSPQPAGSGTVWWYDGQTIAPLTAPASTAQMRAKGERALDISASVVAAANSLSTAANTECIAAIGFGVAEAR